MGNITSRPDDTSNVYLKDQSRFSLKSLIVSNGRKKVVLNLTPNAFPATRLVPKRDAGDEAPISFIQDAESLSPAFLLQIDLEDELDFRFTFLSRQVVPPQNGSTTVVHGSNIDTTISGLTFAYAASAKELDTLITREFHANPNLHKNSNVQFIGDFATQSNPAIEYQWSWRWRPPKTGEDKGGGWRNHCSFLEYDSRAHRLNTLASFAFWVHNKTPPARTPVITSPFLELASPPHRNRMPSSQSYQSTISDSEGPAELVIAGSRSLFSPAAEPSTSAWPLEAQQSVTTAAPVIDVSCQRPGEDISNVEDGPVFRATMKSLEQKTGTMRIQIKKVLKRAEAAHQAQVECNESMNAFMGALQEASGSNASAFKPALDHYFTKIAKCILSYEAENGELLRKQIIEPLSKLYNLDIKQADAKKRDFEDESRDYYQYVGRYLGQRQDSLKEKKRAESDSKYQAKKKTFELARFDYSSFMQDLHGGRKEQELLSQLTKYADGQAKSFLATAQKVENLQPRLDALVREVKEADKEYRLQRTEREEKRRNLELNTTASAPPDSDTISQVVSNPSISAPSTSYGATGYASDTDLSRADSTSSQFNPTVRTLSPSNSVQHGHSPGIATTSTSTPTASAPTPSKFRGIRDLEERDLNGLGSDKTGLSQQRKEGLLWALSKPGSHIDPKGINKQAWHKFWIVLDQGKLSEYSNWKDRLDLHRDPIDLRMASVRMARDAERRFCFEVITPQYKRVYQATTEDEMVHWISAINNALQSAMEGRANASSTPANRSEPSRSEYGAVLTGKPVGQPGSAPKVEAHGVSRSSTVGSRPAYVRTTGSTADDHPTQLLDLLRANDQGNQFCADCGSNAKVEWTSINLGIILCIECGGIHRSLGTHVSKIRSLTLDVKSFTADTVEILMLVGNRISNMVWESKLEQKLKPEALASREARLKFITAKYVERAYVDFGSAQAHFPAADDNLLTSIKKNDIQGVLSAIAQRANVNSHDRSRNTHAVFLALAATDPAYPAATTPSSIVSPIVGTGTTPISARAFPIAELLIQNGAEIPSQMPAIPLSPAAQLYIDQRTTRVGSLAGGDTLGPLPNVSTPTGRSGGDGKLQKRGSAGARFAGKVTGLAER